MNAAAPNRLLPWIAVSLALLPIASGRCADPSGAYDDFVERRKATSSGDNGGKCGSDKVVSTCSPITADSVANGYLLTLAVNLLPSKPYVAIMTAELDEAARTITMTMQPLRADDRKTPAGDPFVGGPFPIEDDGSFVADFGEVILPGATNPISGRDLLATLILVAQPGGLCDESGFACGIVEGRATEPITIDLEGSTFTLQRLPKLRTLPDPLLDCSCTPAEPL